MKNQIYITRIVLTILSTVIFSQVNAQTREIRSFMDYCLYSYDSFINPIYGTHNIRMFTSEYISTVSFRGDGNLKREYAKNDVAIFDTIGRFVYAKKTNPSVSFELELDYPHIELSHKVDSIFNHYTYQCSHYPVLCYTRYTLKTHKKGKLKSTMLWDPTDSKRNTLKTHHTILGDFARKTEAECTSMQWPFFDDPVTRLPANYIHQCMLAADTAYNTKCEIKMIRLDTSQTMDSAFYYSSRCDSGKLRFHCLIEFKYPYYYITQYRPEEAELEDKIMQDQAIVHFDGRPHIYTLWDRVNNKTYFTTYWLYNSDDNVLSIELVYSTRKYNSNLTREFKYTYYR